MSELGNDRVSNARAHMSQSWEVNEFQLKPHRRLRPLEHTQIIGANLTV
jgi:hypothetical protein